MDITTQQNQGISVIALSGRFDAHEVPAVRSELEKLAAARSPAQIVVSLAAVHFIDSSGLACLVQGMKHCRERNGDLYLAALQQPVRIIFELTRLDRAFSIFPDEDAAQAAFSAP